MPCSPPPPGSTSGALPSTPKNTSELQNSTLEALGKVIYLFDNTSEKVIYLFDTTSEKVIYLFDNTSELQYFSWTIAKTQQTIKLLKMGFKMELYFITFKFDFGKMFKVIKNSYDKS